MLKLAVNSDPGPAAHQVALADVAAAWPARPTPQAWPRTQLQMHDILELAGQAPFTSASQALADRRRGARKLLTWLASHPGETWQDRWLISGADTTAGDWLELPVRWLSTHWDGVVVGHRRDLRMGVHLVIGGGVVRPTYQWMMRQLQSPTTRAMARQVMDPAGFQRVDQFCRGDALITDAMRQRVIRLLTYIVMAKGGTVDDITVGDLLELLHDGKAANPKFRTGALTYRVLRELGVFPSDTPPSLRAARTTGPRSAADLVARYQIACQPVQDLLVDYLTERTKGQDYTNLRQLVTMLAGNFWAGLERHHPGIDSLDLPPEVATAWKERLRHVRDRDGRIVRERTAVTDILINVRALYLDLAQWAVEEPSRWGRWVAPCPISAAETNTRKYLAHRKARMDQRTRDRLPVLPTLVGAAEQRKHSSRLLRDAALATPPGELFTVGGREFQRPRRYDNQQSTRIWAIDLTTGQRRDTGTEEEHGFWAWAAIEVLRHTGVRIEELLELTHHNFVTYTLPSTGEIVPLLQITPSKVDRERMLVVTPELGEVLTAIIHRVRDGRLTLPLVSAYHPADQIWSAPMPFLFQRRHGHEQRAITNSMLRTLLDETLAATGLTDAEGQPLRFIPHDFRRIFITDAILHGLPPHIAQVIAGHSNINTTIAYKAAYPIETINAFRGFLARRRHARPTAEYRPVTAEEWDEFLGHFAKRKLSLGDCGREYGSPCQHEHACIRCPLLRPDPTQRQRLLDIRANLLERIDEARHNSWIGEVDGLQATLAATDHKLAEMTTLKLPQTVHLGLPAIPTRVSE